MSQDTRISSKSLPYAERVTATVAVAHLTARDSSHALREVLLQAPTANTDNIEIGNETTRSYVLEPGDTLAIPLENPGVLFFRAVSGAQVLNAIGRD